MKKRFFKNIHFPELFSRWFNKKRKVEKSSGEPQEKAAETKKKKRRKKHSSYAFGVFLLRSTLWTFLLLFLTFTLLYCSIVLYWEKHGIPEIVLRKAENIFLEHSLLLEVEKARTLFPFGVEAYGVRLAPVKKYTGVEFAAEHCRLELSLALLLKKVSFPFLIDIKNSRAKLPVYPELAQGEGAEDLIEISRLFMKIRGEKGFIHVQEMKGETPGGSFEFSGTVNNFLHTLAAEFGHDVTRRLWEKKDSERLSGLDYCTLVRHIPEELRKYAGLSARILRHEKVDDKNMLPFSWHMTKGKYFLKTDFHIDLYDLTASKADTLLLLPESKVNGEFLTLKLEKGEYRFTLEKGILSLQECSIAVGKGEFLSVAGKYDLINKQISATAKGKVALHRSLPFLSAQQRKIGKKWEKELRASEDKKVNFTSRLTHYSLKNNAYELFLDLELPELELEKIRLEKSSCSIHLTPEKIEGKGKLPAFSCSPLPGKKLAEKDAGTLSYSFRYFPEDFQASCKGKIPFEFLENCLQDKEKLLLQWKEENKWIRFSGKIKKNKALQNKLQAELNLSFPEFSIFGGGKVNSLTAETVLTNDCVTIKKLQGILADSFRFSLKGKLLPFRKKLLLTFQGNGSPEDMLKEIAPSYRKILESELQEIVFPKKGALSEFSAQLYMDYGKKPSLWFLDGNIVLSDFQYRKIPFKYFATRFFLDSEGKLALPGAVLETAQGRAVLNGIYEEKRLPAAKASQGLFAGNGRLVFDLESTMNGNDILKCLYPQWKSDFLDFPYPVKVDAAGSIDYKNDAHTSFTASISNGRCYWKKAALSNIDCNIYYANERLLIPNASAVSCNGNLALNYSFDFNEKRENGRIELKLKNADFSRLMKGMEADLKQLKGLEANCSGTLSADLAFDKNDQLLLYGKGEASIKGEDMWHIPVLGELLKTLGKAWQTKALGTITQFDMQFSLDKTLFRIEQGSSNGSVVALRTDGYYDWLTEEFDFHIQSELLKGTLPFAAMSKVLTPVSWILRRRFHGKGSQINWGEK